MPYFNINTIRLLIALIPSPAERDWIVKLLTTRAGTYTDIATKDGKIVRKLAAVWQYFCISIFVGLKCAKFVIK
jgi:hypothetical protein